MDSPPRLPWLAALFERHCSRLGLLVDGEPDAPARGLIFGESLVGAPVTLGRAAIEMSWTPDGWLADRSRASVRICTGVARRELVWGAFSANVRTLRSSRPIPHFAHNWAVAVPILVVWILLAYVLARRYFMLTGAREEEGLFLGLVFAASAFLFDLIVVAGIVGEGCRHFRQPVLWVAYALLLVIPWVGHAGFVA